jgi:bifunctional non-homologous end joining protein LigD
LLNPIDEPLVLDLIQHQGHCAQEKFDGRRLLVRKEGAAINGINRKGNLVGLPETLFQVVRQFDGDVILDGESIGDNYHAFDLLNLDGVDIRHWPYRERLAALMSLLFGIQQTVIKFAETAFTVEQKLALLEKLRQGNKEGIVFKLLSAPYTPGRPNSGGSQLKHKFYATLSAVVARINVQRSVSLRLLNHEGWIPVGNVTIPPNQRIPKVGAIVEIRYLYAFKDGCLYQPIYQGVRNDVGQEECVVSQLKYKPEDEE